MTASGEGRPRVLLVGESWISYTAHLKGFNFFPAAFYEEGLAPLQAALAGFAELVHMPGHLAATQFPMSVGELQAFDVILFSDIGSDSLLLHPDTFLRMRPLPNRLDLVRSFVEQGGGFGMIGGYMSFGGFEGKAHYHATPIERILPVEISPYDDRVERPEGVQPVSVTRHPILDGIEWPWPPLLGYNRLRSRQGAQVLLTFEEDPLLVIGTFGRGRAVAYASDMSPHWGSEAFVSWQGYPRFWCQLVSWLAAK